MVEGLIGKKIGMTQTFDESGNVHPATVIQVEPCTVIQKKTPEKDGYSAVQLGLLDERENRANKPIAGHLKKAEVPGVKILREFRFVDSGDVQEGTRFFVDIFSAGEKVDVTGLSKGKGFAGVIKRWGFSGGKATHGSMFHRAAGSIGQSAWPSRVIKGKRMPGHMGNSRVTVKNLQVLEADKEKSLLVLRGAVPGANGGYLLIRKKGFDTNPPKEDKKE